jgi:hypothetical protein
MSRETQEPAEGMFGIEVAWEDSASVGIWVSFSTVSLFCILLTFLAVYTRKIFNLDEGVDCIHVFAPNITTAAGVAKSSTAVEQLTMPLGNTRCTYGWILILALVSFLLLILLIAAFCRSDPARRSFQDSTKVTPEPSKSDSIESTPMDVAVAENLEGAVADFDTPISSVACLRADWIIFRPFVATLAVLPALDSSLQVMLTRIMSLESYFVLRMPTSACRLVHIADARHDT